MSTDKPSRNEDEYFAREEAERLAKLRAREKAAQTAAERKSHYMKCPKDGADLQSEAFHGVQIDRCPECHGIWLDGGEIELLMKSEDSGMLGRAMGDLWTTLKRGRGKS
ncbi:MAG TPA: zf-TFIIB domain-containing protein [Gemmatimonadales bacterium]|nr:zf-TFIIB domain-containing protein [Gemmatimonadales bacterium]